MKNNDELTYDPRTKQLIKDKIYQHLYEPTKRQFQQRLKAIVVKNSLIHQNGQPCFRFNGQIYSDPASKPPFPLPINDLHTSLESLMEEYLEDQEKLNKEELPYVLNYITQVLNSSEHLPDYFKLFPSSVHPVIQELIDSCVCRAEEITMDKAEAIKQKNTIPIELMKQRMVLNLLI